MRLVGNTGCLVGPRNLWVLEFLASSSSPSLLRDTVQYSEEEGNRGIVASGYSSVDKEELQRGGSYLCSGIQFSTKMRRVVSTCNGKYSLEQRGKGWVVRVWFWDNIYVQREKGSTPCSGIEFSIKGGGEVTILAQFSIEG